MSQSKAEAIVTQLLVNAADLRYGAVSVTVKMHDGEVVSVSYTKTEYTREQENKEGENQSDVREGTSGRLFLISNAIPLTNLI